MYFTIYPAEQGQFRWNLKSANHENICSGESYHNKADCVKAIQLVNGMNNYPTRDLTLMASAFGTGLMSPWRAAMAGIESIPASKGMLSSASIASAGLLGHAIESASSTWKPTGLLSDFLGNGFAQPKR
ncbi:YegP family protein [Massilia soli]|uniref:DUF1508 domain-containing protein n=1 Tax=Massilia soli TaxID=2792854 RepID=A0ABS7SN54_9BURK|nr:DUF1508 domain-containing protein [Massilia soli]MBZ2206580.1 DUF1508 domain-containing protein [Massilia soli]